MGYATEPSTGDDPATPGPGTGGDYTAISVADAATVTIAPGQKTAEFTVQTLPDELDEADETFTVRLADPDPPVGTSTPTPPPPAPSKTTTTRRH